MRRHSNFRSPNRVFLGFAFCYPGYIDTHDLEEHASLGRSGREENGALLVPGEPVVPTSEEGEN